MEPLEISITDAKARLHSLASGKQIYIVTSHGKPLATLTPLDEAGRAAIREARRLKRRQPLEAHLEGQTPRQ